MKKKQLLNKISQMLYKPKPKETESKPILDELSDINDKLDKEISKFLGKKE